MNKRIRRPAFLFAAALAMAGPPAGSAFAASAADRIGSAVPENAPAERIVTVVPKMRAINVIYGETVRFALPDGKQVSWRFDGYDDRIPLDAVASTMTASTGTGAPDTGGVQIYVDHSQNPMRSDAFSE